MKRLSTSMGSVYLQKNEIIIITKGEYDDYGIQIVMEALKDFNIYEAEKQFLKAHPLKQGKININDVKFILWLVLNEYIQKIDVWNWHFEDTISSNFGLSDI